MLNKLFIILVISSLFTYSICFAQQEVLYKQIDTTKLFLEIHYPHKMDTTKEYAAMVFFFGGGWNGGNRHHFLNQAKHFSSRGLVCFLVDYRTKNKHGTTPFESLKDAKSAIRFIRKNATEYRIDPTKIITSGGSAGGHLAAATALIEDYNEATDDLTINPVPNALVLFNPVIDNGPGGYGYERIGAEYNFFSPLHNIKKGAPPTLFLLGTKDNLIPVETAKYYQKVMEIVESRCDLVLYEGANHGFFNKSKKNGSYYFNLTLLEADKFLQSLGYLEGEPVLKIE